MVKNKDLLSGPIFPVLASLAVPIMATSFIQMAYNLTDMIWLGRLGADAVASVGAAGMFMWFSNGLATLAKIGGQIKVAQSLGANDQKKAIKYAQSALQLGMIFACLFAILTLLFSKQMISFFKLNSALVEQDARSYLLITCVFLIFSFLNQIFTGIFTAMGNSKSAFIASTVGLIANIILDPLFIFGGFSIPAMGVTGAATATILAQVIVTLIFFYMMKQDVVLFPHVTFFKKVWKYEMYEIFKIGLPAALQTMLFSCISIVIARIIADWGDHAVAIQKVGSQIESISWMTAEGYAAALNSFVAQNYGANFLNRIHTGVKLSIKVMLAWGFFTTLILLFFPNIIFKIFISDETVLPMGVEYLQILAFSQAFMCLEYASAGAFQGIGKTTPPSIVSIVFTAARIPLAILLSSYIGLNGIWWALTVSSITKGLVLYIWYNRTAKSLSI